MGSNGSINRMINQLGISLDVDGRIYIADRGDHGIIRTDDMMGTNWATFGNTNNFIDPSGIYIH